MTGSLVCRGCATTHSIDERFCPRCKMPLVYSPDLAAGGRPITEQHERARKVQPQYGEGPLVKVGWAANQPEAELIAGLLLEEGIPSVIQRNGGFDVPDFLAAGPRDVLVAESGAEAAREILAEQRPTGESQLPPRTGTRPEWVQALSWTMVVVLVATAVVALLAPLID